MPIDHEEHKIRIKAVSDKMNHPMEYNDAGAPTRDDANHGRAQAKDEMRKFKKESRERNMITGGK